MPLTIKPLGTEHDPDQVLIALINEGGDVVILRCFDKDFRNSLTTQLSGALEDVEISYRKGN